MVRVVTEDVVGLHARKAEECVFAALTSAVNSTIPDAQEESLLDFHLQFAHLVYDTFERRANEPGNSYVQKTSSVHNMRAGKADSQ